MRKRAKYSLLMLAAIIAILFAGFIPQDQSRDFKIAKNLDIYFSLFRELNSFYVDEIDAEKLVNTSINEMLQTLDPYTTYYPENNLDDITFMTTGKYGGIGAMIRKTNDYAVVTQVYKGFPADIAGVKPGDILKKVDNKSLKGLDSEKVSDNLKGDPGTSVELTVEKNGVDKVLTLKREKVAVSPVPYYGMLDNKTAYIRFTSFTENCAQDVRDVLLTLKEKYKPAYLILDLRGNPGGLMNESAEIVNLFIGPGNDVVSTKGKVKQFDTSYKTTRAAVDENIPLVVLINRSSASAAEIVAGAIQDLDRGVIMGQRSYGKGLVQITRSLSYNGQLKVTTAKYYIPSGRCVQALDFAHRNEDGSVGYIPDSLITEFRTKNGRIVKDGGGISPDVEVIPPMLSQVATELYLNNYIFDFVTACYYKNPDIKDKSEVVVDDKMFDDFTSFLAERKFTYKTATATALENLIEIARKERYYDLHADQFNELEKMLAVDLKKDLALSRPEIAEFIEDDLMERYFYEEGAMEHAAIKDSTIIKAVQLLNNQAKYKAILKPVAK